MPDYRLYFDHQCLAALHLGGKPRVLTIKKVEGGQLSNGTKKSKKPMLYFEEGETPMAINKTNGKTIASLFGNDTAEWIGKKIEVYPTTTTFGKDTVDCIRVRPAVPK